MRTFQQLIAARVIYCALLAAGLSGSFARSLRKRAAVSQTGVAQTGVIQTGVLQSGVLRRLWQAVVVSGFFALIHVWNFIGVRISVHDRWELWRSLLPWR